MVRGGMAVALAVAVGALVALPVAAAPAPSWDGFYAGLFAGNDLTALHLAVDDYFSFDGISGQTQMGGALIGVNHRFKQRWVGSAEIDASIAQGGTTMSYSYDADSARFTVKPEWGASIKGRYGFLASPDTLFYGVAGGVVAVASWGCSATGTDEECPDRMQETMYGWPLLGFGAETRIGPNWRFRYEYDVKFLPTLTFEPMTVTPLSGTANIALVRDLGGGETGDDSFGARPATWTGFYAGVALGHQMSSTRFDGSYDDADWAIDGFGASSITGGAFGGYLHQFGHLVLGVEAGNYFDIGELSAEVSDYAGFAISAANYFQIRGRAGVVVSPSTMVYGLAGWLHSDGQLQYREGDVTYTAGSFSREGYEVGGGIETWLNKRWSVRAEYAYATFSDTESEVSDYVRMTSHVGTGTLAAVYHFGQ